MKSEERHQLAQNDLRVGLNRWLDRIEPYSNHILGGIIVATIVAVGLILRFRSSTAASDAGWREIGKATSTEQLLDVSKEFSGTAAGDWAKLQAARRSYASGIDTALTDRKSSDESLKEAKDLYEELLKQKSSPELREESLKGLALTLEATSGADVSAAIKAYEQYVKEFPEAPFKNYAEFRVEQLKNPDASDFYAWFRKQNPKPAPRPEPMDGKLPSDSALKTPDLSELDLKLDAPEKPKADKPDSSPPGLPAIPPAEGKTPPAAPLATPPASTPPATPPATPSAPAVPMPMPEAPAATTPMPMPEAPKEATPMPEPPKPADSPELPSIPKPGVEAPK
ncbi:MAG TPA: hypothetical protein VM452_15650 [Caulifigura sp.]|jgi:hypothetical protein|nr:hypothetical protein [Caulifigura sp.]